MLKKVMLGTALSAVLFSGAEAHVRTGFYTGVAVGVSKNQGSGNAYYSQGGVPAETQKPKYKQTGSGFVGQIFAGYESLFAPSFVLGSEFAVSMDRARSKNSWHGNSPVFEVTDIRKNTLSQSYKLGLSVNAGVPVSESMTIYGKVGLVNGRFTLNHQTNGRLENAQYDGRKVSKNLWGVEPGVRLKVAMNHGWAVQFDANYAMYQGFKTKNFAAPYSATEICWVKVTPRVWTFLAGVSYKF